MSFSERASLIFVVGASRSGTTLLRSMLSSHSELAMPLDNRTLLRFVVEQSRSSRGPYVKAPREADEVLELWGVPRRAIDEALAADSAADLPHLVRRLFSVFAASKGKTRFGYKMPCYGRFIELIAQLLPESRFVHVIRDGRSVATALVDVDFGPDRPESAAFDWRQTVLSGRTAGRSLGPRRYRECRYESLVTEPEKTLREICDFADLRFEAGMLNYQDRAGELANQAYSYLHRSVGLPLTAELRDFRVELTAREIYAVESIAGDLLGDLGYETVTAPSFRRRLWGAFTLGRLQLSRAVRVVGRLTTGKRARWPYGEKEQNVFLR